MIPLVTSERFVAALDFDAYVARAQKNAQQYSDLFRTARVPDDLVTRATEIPGLWHLLILSEDWCGDAVNTLPILAKWVSRVPSIDMRILGREANPDLMNTHLTGNSRSIPVVLVLDEHFEERGWWGPRPAEMQQWVLNEGFALPKDERYKRVRAWQARDRGRTTIEEVLAVLEKAALTATPD